MTHRTRIPNTSTARRGPRRLRRALPLLAAVPDVRTAEALNDRAAAEELIDDLLALVDAGLVEPFWGQGAIRYAPADPDIPAA
jgi:hypothetical protein